MVRYLFDGHEVENFRCEGDRVLFNVGLEEYNVSLYSWTNAKITGLVRKLNNEN